MRQANTMEVRDVEFEAVSACGSWHDGRGDGLPSGGMRRIARVLGGFEFKLVGCIIEKRIGVFGGEQPICKLRRIDCERICRCQCKRLFCKRRRFGHKRELV